MSARDELPDLAALADPATVVGRQVADALDALDWWDEWSNQIAELIPDVFDGDEGQEAIILRAVDGLVRELEVVGRERDALADLVLALAAVSPGDEDGDCVYCRVSLWDDHPHEPTCPWARASDVLPHRVRNGEVEHDTGPSGCCPSTHEDRASLGDAGRGGPRRGVALDRTDPPADAGQPTATGPSAGPLTAHCNGDAHVLTASGCECGHWSTVALPPETHIPSTDARQRASGEQPRCVLCGYVGHRSEFVGWLGDWYCANGASVRTLDGHRNAAVSPKVGEQHLPPGEAPLTPESVWRSVAAALHAELVDSGGATFLMNAVHAYHHARNGRWQEAYNAAHERCSEDGEHG